MSSSKQVTWNTSTSSVLEMGITPHNFPTVALVYACFMTVVASGFLSPCLLKMLKTFKSFSLQPFLEQFFGRFYFNEKGIWIQQKLLEVQCKYFSCIISLILEHNISSNTKPKSQEAVYRCNRFIKYFLIHHVATAMGCKLLRNRVMSDILTLWHHSFNMNLSL